MNIFLSECKYILIDTNEVIFLKKGGSIESSYATLKKNPDFIKIINELNKLEFSFD